MNINTEKIFYDDMQAIRSLLLKKEIPDCYPEDISSIAQLPFANKYYIDRFDFINISSFALVSKKWVKPLADYIGGKKCLEIMAGKGVLSKCLSDYGADITATDNFTWKWHRSKQEKAGRPLGHEELWYAIEDMDCVDSVIKYGSRIGFIICSWPPYRDNKLHEALLKMREINSECRLIYIGENRGGCTADENFFMEAKIIKDDAGFNYIAGNFQRWQSADDGIFLIK